MINYRKIKEELNMTGEQIMKVTGILLENLIPTIKIFGFTLLFSIPLGLIVAALKMCRFKPISWLTNLIHTHNAWNTAYAPDHSCLLCTAVFKDGYQRLGRIRGKSAERCRSCRRELYVHNGNYRIRAELCGIFCRDIQKAV